MANVFAGGNVVQHNNQNISFVLNLLKCARTKNMYNDISVKVVFIKLLEYCVRIVFIIVLQYEDCIKISMYKRYLLKKYFSPNSDYYSGDLHLCYTIH